MKKRNKKYKPKPINRVAHLRAIKSVQPISESDQFQLWKDAITSLHAIKFGINVSESDYLQLCDVLNVSLMLTEKGIGNEYLTELYAARDGMLRSKVRYEATGKIAFDAEALTAVEAAFDIHLAQLKVCNLGEFIAAYETQKGRIERGDTYKGNQERLAA